MPHPSIDIQGPVAFEPLFLTDESGQPLLVTLIKASYSIDSDGQLSLIERPVPVNFAGVRNGPAQDSSYKYEPECAFIKPTTDVILIGHAYGAGASEVHVRLRIGPLDKSVRVTGDRYWIKSLGVLSMTAPERFERIPLVYELAFGGWDRGHPDPQKHACEARNPVGIGFRSASGRFEDGTRLPNLEDPQNPIRNYGDIPPPAGFGFTSPDWQPRAKLAGTYDAQWINHRMPLLPEDFDRRFFNAASTGLIAPGYLEGDETVSIENASPRGTVQFNLPGITTPECRVQLARRPDATVQTNLDTVIINADEDLVLLLWRGYLPVRNGPHDVVSIQVLANASIACSAAR